MLDEDFDLAGCLAQVREQNQAAARSLVEHLYPMVIRIVRSHLPRRVLEEDLAQDIFAVILWFENYRASVECIAKFFHRREYHCRYWYQPGTSPLAQSPTIRQQWIISSCSLCDWVPVKRRMGRRNFQ